MEPTPRCRRGSSKRASDVAREWFAVDRYQDYLHVHGLSVEAAEGLAKYIHEQIRGELGISSDDARDIRDIQGFFEQGYGGSRFSFVNPARPSLEDQEILLDLLQASKLGIQLSEGSELWPGRAVPHGFFPSRSPKPNAPHL